MAPLTALLARLFGVAGLGLVALHPALALAQDVYPSRAITMVVPYPPGGGGDAQARLIGQKLGETLGQPIVVDNRAGASTAIGAAFVAKARPDGYTLLMSSSSTFTLNPAIRSALPYDPIQSFEPIGLVSRVGLVMLTHPAEPLRTLKDVIAAARAEPDKYSYASFGAGTSAHFVGEMAMQAMGIRMVHVPYKGSAPAMTDLVGGQIPVSFDTVTAAIPMVRAGKVRPIAVSTAKRSPFLPEVPTFSELGYPAVKLDAWGALMAPRGLPPEVHARLEKALAAVMADPGVTKGLADQGVEATFLPSADTAALIERELTLMRATAQRANIRPE